MRHIPEVKVVVRIFGDVPCVRLPILFHFREAYTSMFVLQIVASLSIDFIGTPIPDLWISFFEKMHVF